MIQVIFTYNEQFRKWEPTVKGATTALEASQAFNAVVITCMQLQQPLLSFTAAILNHDGTAHEITPAV